MPACFARSCCAGRVRSDLVGYAVAEFRMVAIGVRGCQGCLRATPSVPLTAVVGTFHTEKQFNIFNTHSCTTSITVKA